MNLAAQRKEATRRELLEAWGYEPTAEIELMFDDLATGDLFRVGEGDYRKITPIEIPDLGVRNSATVPQYYWRFVPPGQLVTRWGITQPSLVDRVRAGEFERMNQRDFETLCSLRELKAQFDQQLNFF